MALFGGRNVSERVGVTDPVETPEEPLTARADMLDARLDSIPLGTGKHRKTNEDNTERR